MNINWQRDAGQMKQSSGIFRRRRSKQQQTRRPVHGTQTSTIHQVEVERSSGRSLNSGRSLSRAVAYINPSLVTKEQWAEVMRPGSSWGFSALLMDT
ncbi:hypothetical protein EYF80_052843 [Liparis tanakae]|uniref:Uncharacterized protein n=1 Tax=Liparis tanakae TaxID=230148 RepID=A0A4Z2F7W7_9TELE|nr:hypothetical protein EYF80_052843 [Liparis tanakae]